MISEQPAVGVRPLSQRCHDCYEFGHEDCGCGECGTPGCGKREELTREAEEEAQENAAELTGSSIAAATSLTEREG